MPHITLEYSANIIERPETGPLLRRMHDALGASVHYNIPDIKSRIMIHDDFLVADGTRDQAFIHLQLAIMPRPEDVKAATTKILLDILKDVFACSLEQKNVSISVEIRELEKASYAKITSGSL